MNLRSQAQLFTVRFLRRSFCGTAQSWYRVRQSLWGNVSDSKQDDLTFTSWILVSFIKFHPSTTAPGRLEGADILLTILEHFGAIETIDRRRPCHGVRGYWHSWGRFHLEAWSVDVRSLFLESVDTVLANPRLVKRQLERYLWISWPSPMASLFAAFAWN
jgi:hypothetical protein